MYVADVVFDEQRANGGAEERLNRIDRSDRRHEIRLGDSLTKHPRAAALKARNT